MYIIKHGHFYYDKKDNIWIRRYTKKEMEICDTYDGEYYKCKKINKVNTLKE